MGCSPEQVSRSVPHRRLLIAPPAPYVEGRRHAAPR
jgi:hypothetical protein